MYLDYLIVFSKYGEDLIEQVMRVLLLLYKAGVNLKPEKWKYFRETIHYLGLVIPHGGWKNGEHTTDTASKLEHPAKQTKLCSFLSQCSVVSWIVPNLKRLAPSLKNELRKHAPYTFQLSW